MNKVDTFQCNGNRSMVGLVNQTALLVHTIRRVGTLLVIGIVFKL